ncbi:MAG: Substrate-specific component RibU of riboflavin ECF transporter [Firmicutes bacterium]|nr:Substrate-specific component RibU of riboflavin ECF transporter [Bacillota bacterium]MDI6705850.1 ECF transporter S component [Bacillota bacterium]
MNKKSVTANLTKISLLGVIGFIIMYIEFPIPLFPVFLKLDLSDMPALLGAFAIGPVAGVLVEVVKNVFHLVFKWGMDSPVGELANFIVGSSFVFTAGLIYSKNKTRATAIKSMAAATVVMGIVGGLANYYILIPFYSKLFPLDVIIDMGKQANSAVVDLKSLVIYGIVPFNLLKGLVLSAITFMVYKHLSGILHR